MFAVLNLSSLLVLLFSHSPADQPLPQDISSITEVKNNIKQGSN